MYEGIISIESDTYIYRKVKYEYIQQESY